MPEIVVADLRDWPAHVGTVADRLWRAWWRDAGHSLEEVEALAHQSLGEAIIPSCLVALEGDRFAGTASLIAQDMEERPNYTPWIAAVWVDPAYRSKGVGTRLVNATAAMGFRAGAQRLYLYTSPSNGRFYDKMGWTKIESDVGGSDIFALDRANPAQSVQTRR